MRLRLFLTLILGLIPLAGLSVEPHDLKRHLLVVYNENNSFARELAYLYANVRDIPSNRILAIECPDRESVPRDVYENQIEKPILNYLKEHDWIRFASTSVNYFGVSYPVEIAVENDIWAIVLIRGIPLKIDKKTDEIAPPQISNRFASNVAAVDSELSVLPVQGLPSAGMLPNRYFNSPVFQPFGPEWSKHMILVTRLDAPLPGQVKKMIRDSVRIERTGLYGRTIFDGRGITDKGYQIGDDWIFNSAAAFDQAGYFPVIDREEPLIPLSEPLADVAVYAGWYYGTINGFVKRDDFQFRPGAIAYHIHSFSAQTLRFSDKNWAGPLLDRGAAAVMGSVAEPYLQFTPHLDRFFSALLEGHTFAEAAYFSQPSLSWMITIIGDPLYRPFAQKGGGSQARPKDPKSQIWQRIHNAHLMLQAKKDFREIRAYLTKQPNSLSWEALGDIALKMRRSPDEIFGAYYQAQNLADEPISIIRIGLKKARYHLATDNHQQALAEFENLVRDNPLWPGIKNISLEAAQAARKNGISTLPETIAAHYQEHLALKAIKAAEQQEAQEKKKNAGKAPFPEAPQIKARKDLIPQQPSFTPRQPKANEQPGRLTEENDPNRLRPMPPPY
jgi:uncharacterized protein (TIGR03790 family)